MADPAPIRPDVTFQIDGEREMVDYVISRIKHHCSAWGEAPVSVALVLESDGGRTVHSFSQRPGDERLAVCSVAAALLWKRAVE